MRRDELLASQRFESNLGQADSDYDSGIDNEHVSASCEKNE